MNTAKSPEQRIEKTVELAREVQALLMSQQSVLLLIPEVAYQVVMDLSAACRSDHNSFASIISAAKDARGWVPMSQLGKDDVRGLIGEAVTELAGSYSKLVQVNASAGGHQSVSRLGSDRASVALAGVLLKDTYMKNFSYVIDEIADAQEEFNSSEFFGRFNLSCQEGVRIVADFQATVSRLKSKIEEMMRLNEAALMDIVRPYANDPQSRDDIMAVAYEGFFRACVKFIPNTQANFYSHLKRWVVAKVVSFLDRKACIVSIETNTGSVYRKLRKAQRSLADEGKVVNLRSLASATGVSESKIEDCYASFKPWTTLSGAIGDDSDPIELPCLNSQSPESALVQSETQKTVADLLMALSPREADVISARYGIGRRSQLLEELAETYGMTLEGIRQVQKKAEVKLAKLAKHGHQMGLGT